MYLSLYASPLLWFAYTVRAQSPDNLPGCGQTCVNNAVEQGPSYGCQTTDATCLCMNAEFGYSIRDCAKQSCPAAQAEATIAYAVAFCREAAGVALSSSSSKSSPSKTTSSGGSSKTSANSGSSNGTSSPSKPPHGGLSTGAEVGIGVGAGVALLLLVIIALLVRRRSRRKAVAHKGDVVTDEKGAKTGDGALGIVHESEKGGSLEKDEKAGNGELGKDAEAQIPPYSTDTQQRAELTNTERYETDGWGRYETNGWERYETDGSQRYETNGWQGYEAGGWQRYETDGIARYEAGGRPTGTELWTDANRHELPAGRLDRPWSAELPGGHF